MARTRTNKITNNTFVWGSVIPNLTDLTTITWDNNHVALGEVAGNPVNAARYNSVGRNASLIPYVLVEALINGPDIPTGALPVGDWCTLPDNTKINYNIENTDIPTLITNFNTLIDDYLRYSTTYQSEKWKTMRAFDISDWHGTHKGNPVNVDGTSNITLQMPEIIDATFEGTLQSGTNNRSINEVILHTGEASSTKYGVVKIGYTTDATNRNYAVQLSNGQMYVNVPLLTIEAGTSQGQIKIADVDYDVNGLQTTSEVTFSKVTASRFYASSDRRLKENIKEFESKKSILELPVVEFDFKNNKRHTIGCIAQDLQMICPEIVHENDNGYLTIEEDKIVYLLLNEVKKLRKELDELKGNK